MIFEAFKMIFEAKKNIFEAFKMTLWKEEEWKINLPSHILYEAKPTTHMA
jgi:hypothetical protein